jgi:hypothetical protein
MAKDPNFFHTLSLLRRELKYNIYFERKPDGYLTPFCPICQNGFIDSEPDMHEVFITKGHVQGCKDEVKFKINVRENVVLVHNNICHIKAQHTEEGKILCAKQIIKYEGYQNILEFLQGMEAHLKVIDHQKYMILEVANDTYKQKPTR